MYKILIIIAFAIFITGCKSDSKFEIENKESSNSSGNGVLLNNSNNMQAQNAIRQIPPISEELKQNFLEAVNNARAETQDCGEKGVFEPAPPITWNNNLYKAAYEHTRDMAIHGSVEHIGTHTSSDWTAVDLKLSRGSYFYERIENNGYKEYDFVKENVAGGTYFYEAQDVVEAWLKSDTHCETLMNKDLKEMGMSHIKENTKYTNYWSLEMGAK